MRKTILLAAALAVAPAAIPLAYAASSADSQMFTLDAVNFKGNSRVATDKLQSIVGMEPGDKVNRDKIVAAFGNVQAEYGKENVGGSIQPLISNPVHNHITVTFQITEDAAPAPVTHISPVLDHETFTGNVKVKSAKLAPALTITIGAPVTSEMIAADLNRIAEVYKKANIGVQITPQQVKIAPGHYDVTFVIAEKAS